MSLLLIPASQLLGAGCFCAMHVAFGNFIMQVEKTIYQTQGMKCQPIQIR